MKSPERAGLVLSLLATACTGRTSPPGESGRPAASAAIAPGPSIKPEDLAWAREKLRSASADDQGEGADFVAQLGEAGAPFVAELIPLLDGPDSVCLAAIRALGAIGPRAAPAASAMAKMMDRQAAEEEGASRAVREEGDPYRLLLCSHDAPGQVRLLGDGAPPLPVESAAGDGGRRARRVEIIG